ncbi:MAG: FHA domain-containing protein [Planctomycetes bacterium]|nr:FHA domain-containing protein [Planctomycetota bacterium]
MIELTLSFERKPIKTFKLNKDTVLLGRDPTCDVQIDNVGVSRHHARIEKRGPAYVVLDLASGNGTYVNGKRVNQYNLNDGDEIGLWNYSILFKIMDEVPACAPQQCVPQPCTPPTEAKEKPAAPPPPPKKLDMDMTIAIDSRQLDLKQKERSSTIRGYLVFQDAKRGTRNFSLLKTATFFGADEDCDFHLKGSFLKAMMPKHACILRDESGFRFVNFASHARGTVNNSDIKDQRLKDGDVIEIGGMTYKYFNGLPAIK